MTPPRGAPKALEAADLRRVMRAAERRGPRDHAITAVLFLTAFRVSELVALDVDDVWVGDKAGRLEVRPGNGAVARQVPIRPTPGPSCGPGWPAGVSSSTRLPARWPPARCSSPGPGPGSRYGVPRA
jgi:hypothetical protein